MDSLVREVAMPPDARALSTLPRIDYTDSFVAETDRARDLTAEQWARRILESAPVWFLAMAPATWLSLGLKHGLPWSREHVLGWPVRHREPDYLLLGADARTGAEAELLLRRKGDSIFFATLLQLDSPVMKRIWAAMEAPHRRVVASLLRRGVRSEEVGDPGFEPGTSSLSETRSNRLS